MLYQGAHKSRNITHVKLSVTGRKCVCGMNYHLKTHLLGSHWCHYSCWKEGHFHFSYCKSCISFNIKVNEGWGPVIYMSRLILMCPRSHAASAVLWLPLAPVVQASACSGCSFLSFSCGSSCFLRSWLLQNLSWSESTVVQPDWLI